MEGSQELTLLTKACIREDLEIEYKGFVRKIVSVAAAFGMLFLLVGWLVGGKSPNDFLVLLAFAAALAAGFGWALYTMKRNYRRAAAAIETGCFVISKNSLHGFTQTGVGGSIQIKGKTTFYCLTSRAPEDRGLGFIALYPVNYYRLDSELSLKQIRPEPLKPSSNGPVGKLMTKYVSSIIEPVADTEAEEETEGAEAHRK